mgnify:CR=1 FL=1
MRHHQRVQTVDAARAQIEELLPGEPPHLTFRYRVVRLWEMPSGKPRGTLSSHTGAVDIVVFSPEGQRLLSGARDGTALAMQDKVISVGVVPQWIQDENKLLDVLSLALGLPRANVEATASFYHLLHGASPQLAVVRAIADADLGAGETVTAAG